VTGTLGKIDETLVEDLASESRVILTGNSDYCKLLVKASQGFVGVASGCALKRQSVPLVAIRIMFGTTSSRWQLRSFEL